MRRSRTCLLLAALLGGAWFQVGGVPAFAAVDYSREIKPLLKARCYSCHGALQQKAGLRLDTAASVRAGGRHGSAVEGTPPLLLSRVTHADEEERMPREGAPLKPAEIELLSRWISEGAPGPAAEEPEPDPRSHWAFQPPRRTAVQTGSGADGNLVDALLAFGRSESKVQPLGELAPGLWLRRVHFDLAGLPPSAEEVEAFSKDPSPAARAAVIARLLEQPEFGERWARHLMDLWRYSDWWGLDAQLRYSQKHVWRWRDWIVESLNADASYSRMIVDMLAADEASPGDESSLRATGFLCRSYYLFNRTTWLDEVVEHTSRAFLGLTMQCVKCHDHKYDPLEHADYYRMRAVFEPYHVRVDTRPGEPGFEKDGLARAFDLHLDRPTHVHRRGDDRQPETNRVIQAGMPRLFGTLDVRPVSLPVTAHSPGLRPHVLHDQLEAASREAADAEKEFARVRSKLEGLRAGASPQPGGGDAEAPGLRESFSKLNPEVWRRGEGDWQVADGHLRQLATGDGQRWIEWTRDHPVDFQARLKFRILGGQMWKSVGLCFDGDETRDSMVYLSAYKDSKLQLATGPRASYDYPAGAIHAMPVREGEVQILEVRVRGRWLNVAVGGEHRLAFLLPERPSSRRFRVATFDAQAEFQDLMVSSLGPEESMVRPPGAVSDPLAEAEALLKVARARRDASLLKAPALEAARQADAARRGLETASKEAVADRVRAAARADALWQKATAVADLAQAELELLSAPAGKRAEIEKRVSTHRESVARETGRIAAPDERYRSLVGAQKALVGPDDAFDRNPAFYPEQSTGRRLALARWIGDRANPLTARVMVNQVWMRVFGESLVPDPADFGRRCPAPAQQVLLDTLAVEFMESGWSFKHLLQLMTTSAAYRRDSSLRDAREETLSADPENRRWWRMNARRLDAQAIRDGLLFSAGLLDLHRGGPPVEVPAGEGSHRRALYLQQHGELEDRFLGAFDNASVFECYRRRESVTPQQALAMANSRITAECSAALEKRLASKIGSGLPPGPAWDREFIRQGFLTLLSRPPKPSEVEACQGSLARFGRGPGAEKADPDGPRARALLLQALMNHNDFVTLR